MEGWRGGTSVFDALLRGSVRCGAVRCGNGSVRYCEIVLLKRPCLLTLT